MSSFDDAVLAAKNAAADKAGYALAAASQKQYYDTQNQSSANDFSILIEKLRQSGQLDQLIKRLGLENRNQGNQNQWEAIQKRKQNIWQGGENAADRQQAKELEQLREAANWNNQLLGYSQNMGNSIASGITDANKASALSAFDPSMAGISRLVNQGGVLSDQQIKEGAARATGQGQAEIAGNEAQLAKQMSAGGSYNPLAVSGAMTGLKSSALGMGARELSGGRERNAGTLPGLLGQQSSLAALISQLRARSTTGELKGIWDAQKIPNPPGTTGSIGTNGQRQYPNIPGKQIYAF